MKDPLSEKETPYQLLGVAETATKQEIDAAFKKLLARTKKVAQVREAWNTLSKPVDRTFENLFLYHDQLLKVPPRRLLENRLEVAFAFSNHERSHFPNIAATHSLAILWWRWAQYREDEELAAATGAPFTRRGKLSESPPIDDLWRDALIRWAMLINWETFWKNWLDFGQRTGIAFKTGDLDQLKQRLTGHLTSVLYSYQEKYRTANRPDRADALQQLERVFEAEAKLTRLFEEAEVTVAIGGRQARVTGGRLLLAQLDLESAVIGAMQQARRQGRDTPALRALATAFSAHGHVAELLERKRWDEAIAAIDTLPAATRDDAEVRRMRAKACLERGNECFSLDQTDDALGYWQYGLDTGELQGEIRQAIASQVKARAAALQAADPAAATRLLEIGLQLTPDSQDLRATMSVVVAQRGVGKINEALDRYKAACGRGQADTAAAEARRAINAGLDDLREAVKLDGGNQRARDNLKAGSEVLDDLELIPIRDDLEAKRWVQANAKVRAFLRKHPGHAEAQNMQFGCLLNLCWFCDDEHRRLPVDSAEHEIDMWQMVDSSHYRTMKVPIPRCSECSQVHSTVGTIGCLLALLFFGLIGFCLYLEIPGGAVVVTAVVAAGILGFSFWTIESQMCARASTKPSSHGQEHPFCIKLQAEGWKFGSKPPNAR